MKTELVSYAAATLTTIAFLPQAVKTLKERDTHSLSFGMYAIFTTGVALWGVYGWLRRDWAIVIANIVTGSLCLAILIAKIRNDLLRARMPPSSARKHGPRPD
jgi:MtN3 and saliva related transmembrane protein